MNSQENRLISIIDKQIAELQKTKDEILAKQPLASRCKVGTWVIKKAENKYYQFNGVIGGFASPTGKARVVALKRGTSVMQIDGDTFEQAYRLADTYEVAQHEAWLASKQIKAPMIAIKGEKMFDPMKCEFYMVTCRGIRGAKVRHTSYAEAEREAVKIAENEDHPTWIVGVVAKVEVSKEVKTKTTVKKA